MDAHEASTDSSSADDGDTNGDGSDTPVDANTDVGETMLDGGALPESYAPWRSGDCVIHTRVPPILDGYSAPLLSGEDLWAFSRTVLMRHSTRWIMSHTDHPIVDIVEGDGWLALVSGEGAGSFANGTGIRVARRSAGSWIDVSDPAQAALWPIASTAAGSDLFVAARTGEVFQYDGASWRSIRSASPAGTTAVALAGTGSALFLVTTSGLQRYNGTTWADVPPPLPGLQFSALASLRNGQVFGVAGSSLYELDGPSPAPQPMPPFCTGAPVFTEIHAGGNYLAANARCAGTPSEIWRRDETGTWEPLPAPPGVFPVEGFHPRPSVSGDVCVGGSAGTIACLLSGSWQTYEESVGPDVGVVTGRSATEVYTGHNSITRWDGSSWSIVPPPPGPVVTAQGLYAAADGSLFFSNFSGGSEIQSRLAGGVWTRGPTLGQGPSSIHGRSPSDVLTAGGSLYAHWDGSSWSTPLNSICTEMYAEMALAGSNIIVGYCSGRTASSSSLIEFNGVAWQQSPTSYLGIIQIGPETDPSVFVVGAPGAQYQLRDSTGWHSVDVPASCTNIANAPIGSPGPSRLVFVGPRTVGRRDATPACAPHSLGWWPHDLSATNSTRAWTDGRWVFSAVSDGNGAELAQCDLGP